MSDFLADSYLVRLGFETDAAGYAKFTSTLGDAAKVTEDRTKSVLESLGKWQVGIVTGFAAVSGAFAGLADKVADADLGYQLFATRMFMNVDAAKQLSIATDVLGHSLDEIAWNVELHERFDVLLSDQQRMAQVLGHGFEPGLKNIRDIRFQFSRFQDELEYGLLPDLISKVAQGLGGPDLLTRLQGLNDWIISHIPEISATISKHLVPVLKDAKIVLSDVAGAFEDTGTAFTNLIGLLSGDHSIEGTTFSFEKFLDAVDHVSHGLTRFVGWITDAERLVVHFADAVVLAGSAAWDALHGNLSAARQEMGLATQEFHAALGDLTKGSGAILGGVIGTAGGSGIGALAGGIIGTMIAPGVGTAIGAGLGGTIGGIGGGIEGTAAGAGAGWLREKFDPKDHPQHTFYLPDGIGSADIHALIDNLAPQYGINPALAHAVSTAESNERQFDVTGRLVSSGKAYGAFQLTPGTAQAYGVNASDPAQNVAGGLRLLADLSKRYNGNLEETLAAYNWGSGKLDRAMAANSGRFDESFLPLETREYISRIEGNLARQGNAQISVTIPVTVHGDTSGHDIGQQIAPHVKEAIRDAMQQANRSDIAQLGSRYQ